MSKYVLDGASMAHGDFDLVTRDEVERRRTMNRIQARKDALIDLLSTPLPPAEARRLATELGELRRDISAIRYGADDRTWRDDMRRKWG